jgi:acetylornithine deacetylase/succinyl-diaminopimelate desuccinylase-like protein
MSTRNGSAASMNGHAGTSLQVGTAPGEWPRLADDLARFVAFATVSAEPGRRPALVACARWLSSRLSAVGFPEVEVLFEGGAPAVVGAWDVDPAVPTLLLYGHYDVQPAGPLDRWTADPFVLRSVGGRLVGRGASDDKGFVLAQLEAVRRACADSAQRRPPVNLRCLYEGEEEIGSPSLPHLLRRHRELLRSDATLICDTEGTPAGRPSLTLSCRGEITVNIEVGGPGRELHAGRFGGAIRNPAEVLAETISTLHDRHGRVRLNGFYNDIRPLHLETADDAAILTAAGVPEGWGEDGYGAAERVKIRPAAIVTQLAAGMPGSGPHHSIPSKASAQLNVRLVPDQDPGRVYRSVVGHVSRHRGPATSTTTRLLAVARPWQARLDDPAFACAISAVRDVTGEVPAEVRSGGSIPALSELEGTGVSPPPVLLGFGNASDRAHGPEESVAISRLDLAARTMKRFLQRLGA